MSARIKCRQWENRDSAIERNTTRTLFPEHSLSYSCHTCNSPCPSLSLSQRQVSAVVAGFPWCSVIPRQGLLEVGHGCGFLQVDHGVAFPTTGGRSGGGCSRHAAFERRRSLGYRPPSPVSRAAGGFALQVHLDVVELAGGRRGRVTTVLLAGATATASSLTSEVEVENTVGPLMWVRVGRESVTKTVGRL